jgi:rSAM/selenodomain-associated transferase 2
LIDRVLLVSAEGNNVMPPSDSIISIVIPVLNESGIIRTAIENLHKLIDGKNIEIIVVDGDPAGSTIGRINGGPPVVSATAPRGRARQMNHGASLAGGDIIVFLHADTLLPCDALVRIRSAVARGYRAGAFSLGISSDRWIFRITETYAALRTRFTGIPFGDQAFFVRRDYFRSLGGFADIPIMEDIELMGRIKKGGQRVCILPDRVMTSPRRWEKEGLVSCTLRNWCLQLLYALGVHPRRLVQWYK